jgi:hypothetical protein
VARWCQDGIGGRLDADHLNFEPTTSAHHAEERRRASLAMFFDTFPGLCRSGNAGAAGLQNPRLLEEPRLLLPRPRVGLKGGADKVCDKPSGGNCPDTGGARPAA